MSNAINALFQFLENRLGLVPTGVATIALFAFLVAVVLALLIFARLRRARKYIEVLAEKLGYEPPYGDGEEVVHEEVRKNIVQRGKELKVEQLETRIGELEVEVRQKDASFAAMQKHSQELEEQLRQAALQNDSVEAQLGTQAKAHRAAIEQLEQRMRDSEAESNSSVTALHHRAKDLEEQLQQAFLRNDKVMALANDQAQGHQRAVDQFDQRVREIEAENDTKLTAVQRRSKELEEQLKKATQNSEQLQAQAAAQVQEHRGTVERLEGRIRKSESENEASLTAAQQRARQFEDQARDALRQKDSVLAQADEVTKAHRETVAQLEDHIRLIEGESRVNLNGLQQRTRELEEQLQQVYKQRDQVMAQASDQAQAHKETLTKVEQRIHEIEAQSKADLNALEHRSRQLEEQLQQAAMAHEIITTRAGEQARLHEETVAQLEGYIRKMEGESKQRTVAHEQRTKDLEEQLEQAVQHHERIAAEAGAQAQAHRETVAELEGRVRQVEGESSANLNAIQVYAKDIEEQLRHATLRNEDTAAQAAEQARKHLETVAQLEGRIRQVEGESNANLNALRQRSVDLEDQLQQATLNHEKAAAQAGEQVKAHREIVAHLEERVRQVEGESNANLNAIQQHARDLEEQLRQATVLHEKTAAQAGEQAQAHREMVGQLEGRIRQVEGESSANLNALQQRAGDLEEQLRQATLGQEKTAAQASEQARAHREIVGQLEGRIRQVEGESNTNLSALQQQASDLEEQLRQATERHEKTAAQADEQARLHLETVAQLEARVRQIEGESNTSLSALQLHARDLEEQLRQATLHHEKTAAQTGEQARLHAETVAQLESRIRQVEGESTTNLNALQQHAGDLEEQLRQATLHHEKTAAQAGEQARLHSETVAQLEGRIRQVEGESTTNLNALQQRAGDLEDQLRQATLHHEKTAAQAGEQARLHAETVAQLAARIRQMEGESSTNLTALQQHAEGLEERLGKAALHNESLLAQVAEQARLHGETVAELEGRIHQVEGEKNAVLPALEQRTKDLEEQLEKATIRNDQVLSQAAEQIQAYRLTVEKLEERIHATEMEGNANLTALEQRSTDLEEQLRQAATQYENEKSAARQVMLDRTAGLEQVTARVRVLEAAAKAKDSHLATLQAQIEQLESQLQQAPILIEPEVAKMTTGEGTAEALMRRADWIVSHAVGSVLPHGLVAAEVYASAALAANPRDAGAQQLLAELARIRRAYPEGLPSITEAVTGFDERAAAFFAADPARAAGIAEEEAQRRYRAGLNRSALLMTNTALELRQHAGAVDGAETERLQEMKSSLLSRLG